MKRQELQNQLNELFIGTRILQVYYQPEFYEDGTPDYKIDNLHLHDVPDEMILRMSNGFDIFINLSNFLNEYELRVDWMHTDEQTILPVNMSKHPAWLELTNIQIIKIKLFLENIEDFDYPSNKYVTLQCFSGILFAFVTKKKFEIFTGNMTGKIGNTYEFNRPDSSKIVVLNRLKKIRYLNLPEIMD